MSIGTKIRELRIAKGMTQSELGNGLVTPSMISQIESDKANPSYKVLEAIAERLETPLEQLLVDAQTNLEKRTTHKIAKAFISAQKYERAVELLLSVYEDTEILDKVEMQLDLGDCYFNLGQHQAALAAYEKAIEFAEKAYRKLNILQALNKIGEIELHRQKYHLAVFHWRKAEEMIADLKEWEPFLHSQILTNLGYVHHLLGEFETSQSYYSNAYHLLNNTSNYEQIRRVYLGLAENYKQTGVYDKASEFAQHAISISYVTKNLKISIDTKKNYAMILADSGDTQNSVRLLNDCLEAYQRENHRVDVALVYRELALLHFKEQNYALSLQMCDSGLDCIQSGNELSDLKGSLLVEQARAQYELGQLEQAVESIETATEIFKSHGLLTDYSRALSLLAEFLQKKGEILRANESLLLMKRVLDEQLQRRVILR